MFHVIVTVSMEERPSLGYTFFKKKLVKLYGKFAVILNMLYAKNVQIKVASRCNGVCIFCAVWVQSMSI